MTPKIVIEVAYASLLNTLHSSSLKAFEASQVLSLHKNITTGHWLLSLSNKVIFLFSTPLVSYL